MASQAQQVIDDPSKPVQEPPRPSKRGRLGEGRPRAVTLDTVRKVSLSIARGLTEEQACGAHGVSWDTYRHAKVANPEYRHVQQKLTLAWLNKAVERCEKGQPGWQGTAWLLERRYGPQFRRTTVEVSLDARNLGQLSDNQLVALLGPDAKQIIDVEASVTSGPQSLPPISDTQDHPGDCQDAQ